MQVLHANHLDGYHLDGCLDGYQSHSLAIIQKLFDALYY